MKGNQERYKEVKELPKGAKTVKLFAIDKDITTSHVYKQYNQGKLEIVVFQGVNFVLKPE